MDNLTLESLAKRVELLELAMLGEHGSSPKDWRKSLGMFRDSEVMRQVEAEGTAIRVAERLAAQREGATS